MARVVNVTEGVIYYSGRPALCLCMGCYIHVYIIVASCVQQSGFTRGYMYFIGNPTKTAIIYTKCFISEPIITELIDTLARYPLPV